MEKAEIRARALSARDAIPAQTRREMDRRIRERLYALPVWQMSKTVLTYLSFGSEVDTWEIAGQAVSENKALFCPRIMDRRAGHMAFYRTDPEHTMPGFRGIREPVGNEMWDAARASGGVLLLMPGVAFSVNGDRIGYGGGFYDRFLADRADLMNRVALCYDVQVMREFSAGADTFPQTATDVRVQRIITENGVIICEGGT
ncbi:MAG: 5-formyltetrahydrofolate cyclo-ligase [Lachnospiraceae bacterium]|nr:5-formyltetrahydrofolate cyclo-ligase [Lachnospiraceae bacterium]